MSALTDRLLAEMGAMSSPTCYAHCDCERCVQLRRDTVSALLRALAGETLDAAAEAVGVVCGHQPLTQNVCPQCRDQLLSAIRAPLLVQVAELEAQLAAAREALEAIANLPTPRAEMDGSKKVGDPDAFAYNYQHIARAALTGATQK